MGFYDSIRLGSSAAGAYEVEKSLRINKPDNPQLYRTGSNNADTFTISMWIKIGRLYTTYRRLFSSYADGLVLNNDHRLRYSDEGDGSFYSTAKFRDPSAWYHIVMAVNTSGTTVYVNNVTHITSSSKFSLSTSSNAIKHFWHAGDPSEFTFDGYGADVALIDGQALTPSSFAETDALTGQWIPKDLSSLTFGSNGHWLKFTDSTNIGKDFSGNSNDFTTANFSVSAGAGNDSVEDTPTNNFSTFNPLLTDQRTDAVYSEGNTKVVTGSGAGTIGTSFAVNSGKWYAEFKCTAKTSVNMGVGIQTVTGYDGERQWNESQNGGFGIAYLGGDNASSGNKMTDGGGSASYGASYVVDDIIGVALDVDNKTVNFYKNNSAQGTIDITTTKGDFYVMTVGHGQGGCTNTWEGNFGQRAFSYTPPTGFVAMNSQNLPDPSIKLPNKHFETLTYTGDSNTSRNITGLQFQPDLVWIKRRSASANHRILDSVRGSTKELYPNLTNAESTFTGISSFNSDGFTLATADSNYNLNTATYVAWNWNGGGSTASNSDGSITSSVRANTSAGFSIVSYTGNGSSGATIGHGLGVAPDVYIVKRRDGSNSWQVFHQALGNQKFLELHDSGAEQTSSNRWNNTSPTSTVFTVGDNSNVNSNGGTGIAYCFSQVAGYSKFGKYTGNGSTDGPFVYTGFRPAFVLIKRTDAAENWWLYDNKRNPYNPMTQILYADQNNAEISATGNNVSNEFLSNGIKFITTNANWNASGGTYIYMAFAETPFKYARAR